MEKDEREKWMMEVILKSEELEEPNLVAFRRLDGLMVALGYDSKLTTVDDFEVFKIKERLIELDNELYNRPRNFWKGTRFTPEGARSHYDESRVLVKKLYDRTGQTWSHNDKKNKVMTPEEETYEFKKKRYLEINYPSGF